MARRQRLLAVIVAIPGALCCLAACGLFLSRVVSNEIVQFLPGTNIPTYYLEVGRAYSGGFVTGFFLCFFLVLLAVAVGTWVEQRRAAANTGR